MGLFLSALAETVGQHIGLAASEFPLGSLDSSGFCFLIRKVGRSNCC